MKLPAAIRSLGVSNATEVAQIMAENRGLRWDSEVKYVFKAITEDPARAPNNIGGTRDSEREVIEKWIRKYLAGFEGRASRRSSNLPGTVADPMIEEIIGARITSLTTADLSKVNYAHRLAMSAENVLGLLLEEYLADNLRAHRWHCAWGETVKSVDFVNEDGQMLQIKNRSNSENSSSSAIRSGTTIQKWYRIKADRVETMWGSLNQICQTNHLSEQSFVDFVKNTVTNNPACLAVEPQNPWN